MRLDRGDGLWRWLNAGARRPACFAGLPGLPFVNLGSMSLHDIAGSTGGRLDLGRAADHFVQIADDTLLQAGSQRAGVRRGRVAAADGLGSPWRC